MRRYLLAGLLVWLPIWGTYYILRFIIRLLDDTLALIPNRYHPDTLIGFHIPGLGLVFTLIILFITGLIVTNILGRRLIQIWDNFLGQIPIVRTIYSAIKQVVRAMVQPSKDSFSRVLLVEYPRREIWSIAFQTATGFKGVPVNEEMVTIFIPTTPNPTSGLLTIVPRKDTVEIDMTVEQALKMVISLGVMVPEHLLNKAIKVPQKDHPADQD